MGEEVFYKSLDCKYCRYSCKYPPKKSAPTYDDKYKCCYHFYTQEITSYDDLNSLSKYYESRGSKHNKDLEFECSCKWLVLNNQMFDEQKIANSNSPKQRLDGSYIILINNYHTPKLYKYFCKKKRDGEIKKKVKEAIKVISIILLSVIVCFLGYFLYNDSQYTVDIYIAGPECTYYKHNTFSNKETIIEEGTPIAIVRIKGHSKRVEYYQYNGQNTEKMNVSQITKYDIKGIEYEKEISFWNFKTTHWWE